MGWKDLGWTDYSTFNVHKGWKRPDGKVDKEGATFTTSLDAIVGEIRRRELNYSVSQRSKEATAAIGHIDNCKYEAAPTAPLALCAALMAYLKESRP